MRPRFAMTFLSFHCCKCLVYSGNTDAEKVIMNNVAWRDESVFFHAAVFLCLLSNHYESVRFSFLQWTSMKSETYMKDSHKVTVTEQMFYII
jgi:hypothetical protein